MKQTQQDFSYLAHMPESDVLEMQKALSQSSQAKAWARAFARAQSGGEVTPQKDSPAVASWHRAFEKAGATRR